MMLDTLYESAWCDAIARKSGVHRNDIEDLRQDVAMKLWMQQPTCEKGRERAYLRRVVMTRAVDYHRTMVRSPPTVEIRDDDRSESGADIRRGSEDIDLLDAQLDLETLLAGLSEEEQNALRARLRGLSFREIAATYGEPEGTVRRRVSRAIKKLKAMIQVSEVEAQCPSIYGDDGPAPDKPMYRRLDAR